PGGVAWGRIVLAVLVPRQRAVDVENTDLAADVERHRGDVPLGGADADQQRTTGGEDAEVAADVDGDAVDVGAGVNGVQVRGDADVHEGQVVETVDAGARERRDLAAGVL